MAILGGNPEHEQFVVNEAVATGDDAVGGDFVFGFGGRGAGGDDDGKEDGGDHQDGHDAFDEEEDDAHQDSQNGDGAIKLAVVGLVGALEASPDEEIFLLFVGRSGFRDGGFGRQSGHDLW